MPHSQKVPCAACWQAMSSRCSAFACMLTPFGCAASAHASACRLCMRIGGRNPDSTAPTGSALTGCDAQCDCSATDQLHGLIQCCACRLTGPAESVSLTQLGHRDTGLSRLFLWWVWNQGLPALQQCLKPRVRQSYRAHLEQKIAALQRWLCSLLHIESESGKLHWHLRQVPSNI